MPREKYPSSILAQLIHHIPSMLLHLFEGSIAMWKLRCKLIHPPNPLPLVRISTSALRKLRARQRYRHFSTQSQSVSALSLSSLPTPTHSQTSISPSPSSRSGRYSPPLFSQVPEFPDLIEDPISVTYMSVPSVARLDNASTTTYIPVLPTAPSPYSQIRSMSLEVAAASTPSEADCSPPSSFQ